MKTYMKTSKDIRPALVTFLKKRLVFMLTLGVIAGLSACEQEEGFGGTSSVSGKVYALDYNTELTELTGQFYAADEDVFIVFGDDIVYADKTSTFYDGTYRFENLRKGNYTVYAYSKDTTGNPDIDKFAVLQSFEITSNRQDVILPDITIVK